MFATTLLGAIYILTPMIPLLFFYPRTFRRMVDRLVGFWITMPGTVMEFLFGSKVRVVGHKIEHAEPALIIMNHRTRLDWLFFWTALYKMDPWLLISEKISLKGILKYIPGAGWAMQTQAFIFLDRTFANDRTKMEKMLDYYANSGFAYQLLLYPEGTDKCPLATARSVKHANEKGLTQYEYLLHTRTTGFVHIVQRMRRNKYIEYLYDVTVGYGDAIVQSEVELVTHGLAPNDIHYQVIKIPISEIPESDEGLAEWLTRRWAEKEEKLKEFYCHVGNEPGYTFSTPTGGREYEMTPFLSRVRFFISFFWVFVTVMWIYFAIYVEYIALLGFTAVIFFVTSQIMYGGVEWLMIDRFNQVTNNNLDVKSK